MASDSNDAKPLSNTNVRRLMTYPQTTPKIQFSLKLPHLGWVKASYYVMLPTP